MLEKITIFFAVALMSGRALNSGKQSITTETLESTTRKQAPAQCTKVNQVEAIKLVFKPYDGITPKQLFYAGQPVPFHCDLNSNYQAYYAASFFFRNPEQDCFLICADGFNYHLYVIRIDGINFLREKLAADNISVMSSNKDRTRIIKEKKMLEDFYNGNQSSFLLSEVFSQSLASKIIGLLGTTCRTNASHIHQDVAIKGHSINGLQFINQTQPNHSLFFYSLLLSD